MVSVNKAVAATTLIIFLDVDGVLWTPGYAIGQQDGFRLAGGDMNDREAVEVLFDEWGQHWCPTTTHALKWLIEETGAQVVMSASMRAHGLESMRRMWVTKELPGTVLDVTPHLDSRIRGEEIQHWLDRHPEVTGYIILDDDDDMLPSQLPHFVHTDDHAGLTPRVADKAAQLLLSQLPTPLIIDDMTIKQRIKADIITAMKAKDQTKLTYLRSINNLFIAAEKEAGVEEVADADAVKILTKYAGQRREGIAFAQKQSRQDLVDKEQAELDVVESYLPKQLSAEETAAAVAEVITAGGFSGMGAMRDAMAAFNAKYAGQVDPKAVGPLVKAALTAA